MQKQQNEEEVNELEALIDTLQQAKETYAGGHSLEKDKKFKNLFKKFKNELTLIEVTKIQSEKDTMLSMFTSKRQTIKDRRNL